MQPVRMALAAQPTQIPLLMMLMDVEFEKHGGNFEELGNIACIANSHFTAEKYRGAYGVNPTVIYPIISPDKYRTPTTRETVTFINPVVEKGRDVALEIARLCPQIPFSFVEGWPLSPEQRQELTPRVSALRNVTLLPPQSDMRNVYRKCKILLAPSLWEEAYGRVATEAQMNGIPVVASNRGGLPEAVGSGGILLSPDDPIEHWVTAITKLWYDNRYYAAISDAALAHASRSEISQRYIFDAMKQTLAHVCKAS
jgi:glycosyltransferase involved in cell wall biosynthesis